MKDTNELSEIYFQLLKKIGKVANIMVSPAHPSSNESDYHIPLVLKWGYIEDNNEFVPFFEHVVKTFESPIEWTLEHIRRDSEVFPFGFVNWWLFYPKRITEISKEKNLDAQDSKGWIRDHEPELALKSNQEFPRFAQHMIKCYEEWFDDKIA